MFRSILIPAAILTLASGMRGQEWKWTTMLHAGDFTAGEDLQKLKTRHRWQWQFGTGQFEIAVRRSAIPVPSPKCRMDYLILTMPIYYPESPKQATLESRRAIYDALLKIQSAGKGSLKVHFDPLYFAEKGRAGVELTTCNIYFTLPLESDSARILP
jgi:hypothetical protein